MMREKVQVDERADAGGVDCFWPVDHLQVEPPPRLDDIARDTRVHETAVERHAQHFAEGVFRIRPRTHMHLEDFECQADQVENADGLQFIFRLQTRRQHENLPKDADKQKEIIARQERDFDVFGDRQCAENDQREDAGKRLLPREMDEVFHGPAPPFLFRIKSLNSSGRTVSAAGFTYKLKGYQKIQRT